MVREMLSVHQRPNGAICMAIGLVALLLIIMYPASQLWLSDHITRLNQPVCSLPSQGRPSTPPPPAIPPEYQYEPPLDDKCALRFSDKYVQDFRDHAVSYCDPGSSRSQITCFHGDSRTDQDKDSMCIAQGVDFNVEEGKFDVECSFRQVTEEERNRGLINFDEIRPYWYETGPPEIFNAGVTISEGEQPLVDQTEQVERREDGGTTGVKEVAHKEEDAKPEDAAPRRFPKNYLLLKREGEGNPWHCMMEIFSSYLTIDVLRISRDPWNGNKAFFGAQDAEDTQVIILDDREDGPYLDSWTLFAKHPPIRLHDLKNDPEAMSHVKSANVIIPLAGGSNPMWQPEPEVRQCTSARTVSVFSKRILGLYGVPDPPKRQPEDPIVVTFIDRQQSRRLVNQTALFAEVRERYPHVSVQLVDFATIPFAEQLRIIRETNILVGVHGAGLTHSFFMQENVGTVVEIQPQEVDYLGFRMIAAMRGLSYFRTHGQSVRHEGRRRDSREVARRTVDKRDAWHWDDVRIEPDRFFELMDVAIKSMYSRGAWDYSVNK